MSPNTAHVRVEVAARVHPATADSSSAAVVGFALSTSDSHCSRELHVVPFTRANVASPDAPLTYLIHDLLTARGPEGFAALVGIPEPISRAALYQLLVTEYGGRVLAVGVKWRDDEPLQITGIVTCGPASLGSHWRLSAVFATTHRVPLTLNVMQLAARLWFATLGRQWPRSVSWRACRGSVEGRRILETLLVFHAKRAGPRRPEFWASIASSTPSEVQQEFAPVDVELGAGPFGAELLEDLATWGVGSARWAYEAAPSLSAVDALPPAWCGYVLHSAELPMSCRGFQHLTPMDREELLGKPIAEILNSIAVTQRAAIAKLRNMESQQSHNDADSTDAALWRERVNSASISPQVKPAVAPLVVADVEDDASWRSLFSTKSVTPILTPRPNDVSVLRV